MTTQMPYVHIRKFQCIFQEIRKALFLHFSSTSHYLTQVVFAIFTQWIQRLQTKKLALRSFDLVHMEISLDASMKKEAFSCLTSNLWPDAKIHFGNVLKLKGKRLMILNFLIETLWLQQLASNKSIYQFLMYYFLIIET